MGYSRTISAGYGISIQDYSMFTGPDDEADEFEIIEEIIESYPLLSFGGAGDYRYPEVFPIVVIASTLEEEHDETFDRETDDGNTEFIKSTVAYSGNDPLGLAQLYAFIAKYELTTDPAQLNWSSIG